MGSVSVHNDMLPVDSEYLGRSLLGSDVFSISQEKIDVIKNNADQIRNALLKERERRLEFLRNDQPYPRGLPYTVEIS